MRSIHTRIFFASFVSGLLLCGARVSYAGPFHTVQDKFSGTKNLKPADIDAPITVNGDTVEYSTDEKKVTATGNV